MGSGMEAGVQVGPMIEPRALEKRWGRQGVVDLAGLIGYYSFVSVTLNVFEVPTPQDAKLLEK